MSIIYPQGQRIIMVGQRVSLEISPEAFEALERQRELDGPTTAGPVSADPRVAPPPYQPA